jgi:L-fuculose-phosphate aldolase
MAVTTNADLDVKEFTILVPDVPVSPPLPAMSPEQTFALLARMLYREGYDEHLAGHITWKQPDGTFLVGPAGFVWDEIKAGDVMRVDADGNKLSGRWTVTQAIPLHTEMHKIRKDVGVAIHNHTRWATIWAGLNRAPTIYDQTGAMYHGGVAVFGQYRGAVDDPEIAREIATEMGDANIALLANHGSFILARDPEQAFLRAMSFEWRCRQAWHIEAVGGAEPMLAEAAAAFGETFNKFNFPGLFQAMARREIRRDPSVLD